ncbi:tRNA pseudouridine(54/55) synthase Pus10 [Pyrococcus yayanosii]|uniref:tRNA pseudouridine(54/55) synthase Pus10 n=1 Tax=Pyrococcus yayanosii TaxID=1008460 RepID=UPI00064FB866|nr:tRNA pseudouridine(54/55) synthase Pus10 [Pyrococcus yayanosii]
MIVKKAAEVLGKVELCNHCLGRLFAKLGKGSNEERGKAIRFVLNMERAASELPLLKEPKRCELCGGVFERLEEYANRCLNAVEREGIEFDTFLVGSRFPKEVLEKEEEIWKRFGIEWGEPINREFNRELGKLLEGLLGKKVNRERPDVVFIVEPASGRVELQVNPIYVYGRYRKLVRGIPQTPLPGFRDSVASIICRAFSRAFGGKCVFKGAGREDVDVRMLGRGRPFIVEIKRPKRRKANLEKIAEDIAASGKVEVLEMKFVGPKEAEKVLTERHRKLYEALIFVREGVMPEEVRKVVETLRGAEIRQRTPRRVLNSRSDTVRVRRVYEAWGEPIDETHFRLRLLTDGGLYIKELISGDGGRTRPSVAEILGKDAWCELLDVLDVLDGGDEIAEGDNWEVQG